MAINPNTDFTAGQVLTADQQNRFPRGVMGNVVLTTGLAGVTTLADLPGMTVTFTAVAGRIYKATWLVTGSKNATGTDFTFVSFTNAANTVVGQVPTTTPTGNFLINLSGSVTFTVGSGSVTYKLRCRSSSGTFTPNASASEPCMLVIEDIGPA
jgi:hypothetical protein